MTDESSVAIARCEITGNPCGTDTTAAGMPCGCDACQRFYAASVPTFTQATEEEVVEFVERKRIKLGERPSGSMKIVAVTTPEPTRAKCEWEQCSSPSVGQWRWRREAYNGRDDAFDFAVYCDGHGMMAETNGATLEERFK